MINQGPLIPLRQRTSSTEDRVGQLSRLAKDFVSLIALALVSTGQKPKPVPDKLTPL